MKRGERLIAQAVPDEPEAEREQQGVQALETGLRLLEAFASISEPMRLTEVASAAGMHPAKAHRYLVSFGRYGYVMQQPDGRYELGPASVKVGLSAVSQMDYVRLVAPVLTELSVALNETVFVAIWSPEGPMILRFAAPWRPVAVNVRIGSVLPMLTSAVGRVFTAWYPPVLTQPLIDTELKQYRQRSRASLPVDVEAVRAEVLASGVGLVLGYCVPGVNSVSAPIFDYQHQLVAALAVVGLEGSLGERQLRQAAAKVKAAGADVSAQLGHRAGAVGRYTTDRESWG